MYVHSMNSRAFIRLSLLLNGVFFVHVFISPLAEYRNVNIYDVKSNITCENKLQAPLDTSNKLVTDSHIETDVSNNVKEPTDINIPLDDNFIMEDGTQDKVKKEKQDTMKTENHELNVDKILSSPDLLGSADEANKKLDKKEEFPEPPRHVQEGGADLDGQSVGATMIEESPDPPFDSLERKMYPGLRNCITASQKFKQVQRGEFWVLENYIPAAMSFRCDESITYTTHSEYNYLDNLDPLTSRWQGPVSVSVYAPGKDFKEAVETILYLRNCMAEGIKKYATFHIFFPFNHMPDSIPSQEDLLQRSTACDKDSPKWTNVETYRKKKKLLYPINIARNVARDKATTFFNFPSDIELYPSINVIPEFFKMLKKPDVSKTSKPRVFVFPIFEVEESENAPETKKELLGLMGKKKAIPFHKYVCAHCHRVPKATEWNKAEIKPGLSVFHVGKRTGLYVTWEPIYIGTREEPQYDQRLSWEGKSDKMTQMYILCTKDYEFHILDNAFLVHKPGIKKHSDNSRNRIVSKQRHLVISKILPEYKLLFGTRKECKM